MRARRQPFGHHRAVLKFAQTDRQIITFCDKIKHLIGKRQIDFQFRIAGNKFIHQRCNPLFTERHGCGQIQSAFGGLVQVGDRAFCLGQPIKHLSAVVVVDLPSIRDRDLASRAIEQLNTQPRF